MPFPTITWRLDADGTWGVANNWKPLRVPNFSDDVSINTVHLHTITHGAGADRARTLTVGNDNFVVSGGFLSISSTSSFGHSLTVAAGTLTLGGPASTAGPLTVSGGVLALGGATAAASFAQSNSTVSGTGALTVTGVAAFTGTLAQTGSGVTLLKSASSFIGSVFGLDGGRTLENQGTLTLAGNALRLGFNPFGSSLGGGVLKNDPGGTIDLQGASLIETFSGATSFTNAGTLKKTTSTTAFVIGLAVTNTGAVLVEGGKLEFANGSFTNSGAGTISLAAGTTLSFEGAASAAAGAFTLASGATLDVSGTLTLGAGTVGGPGTLKLEAGALVLGGAVTIGALTSANNSTVSGAASLTVTGSAAFTAQSLETGAGATKLQGASNLAAGASLFLDGARILENQGAFTLTGGTIHLGANPFGTTVGGGTLRNDLGAIFDIQAATTIFKGSGSVTFANAGTFQQTVTTGVSHIQVGFSNTGTVLAQTGTLEFDGAFTDLGFTRPVSVASGASLALDGGGSAHANDFFVAAGGTLDFGGNLFKLNGGTVGGTGTLAVTDATLTLGGAVTIGGTYFQQGGILSGLGNFTVAGPATFAQTMLQTGAATTLLEGASTLSLFSSFNLDGGRVLENRGAFSLTGSSTISLGRDPFGPGLGGGTLKNDATGTIVLQGANQIVAFAGVTGFTNAGLLKGIGTGIAVVAAPFTDTGTVEIDSGTLQFKGAGDSFAGLVSGTGKLAFAGGTHFLNNGAVLTVASWSLFAGASTSVNENLAYAGGFSQTAGATLTIAAGDALSLGGTTSLAGTVNGAGTLALSSAILNGVTIGGTATLSVVGAVDQAGSLSVGDAGSMAATLSIAAGATYGIAGDIARGNAAASTIDNSGLLIKSGSGISVVGVKITNAGTIEAAVGALDLALAIKGGGAMAVDTGATLEVDASASASLDMTFNGGGGTLALGDAARFAATIHAFNPTDTIDLLKTTATAATLGAGNTLVIVNGATTVATLQLAGNHQNDVFTVASDGHGGTNIGVTGGPGPVHRALGGDQRFVAAMAGLGGGGAGLESAAPWSPHRPPTLAGPRVQMA
ncbi:MAG: hypothetical protein H0X27_00310 [Caulobacteraceae bacterium]|nr:hypothetical protein [Caulobacteraceae bacterium]